jgi:hypothetical protein
MRQMESEQILKSELQETAVQSETDSRQNLARCNLVAQAYEGQKD